MISILIPCFLGCFAQEPAPKQGKLGLPSSPNPSRGWEEYSKKSVPSLMGVGRGGRPYQLLLVSR